MKSIDYGKGRQNFPFLCMYFALVLLYFSCLSVSACYAFFVPSLIRHVRTGCSVATAVLFAVSFKFLAFPMVGLAWLGDITDSYDTSTTFILLISISISKFNDTNATLHLLS